MGDESEQFEYIKIDSFFPFPNPMTILHMQPRRKFAVAGLDQVSDKYILTYMNQTYWSF